MSAMRAGLRLVEELVAAAKAGDATAIRQLRACGYFERLKAEKDGVPLLFSQRGVWALHSLGAGQTGAYNITGAYRLQGALRPELLERAGQELVDRHEALRSWFPPADCEPRQYVRMHAAFQLRVEPAGPQDSLTARVRAAADIPFDLQTPPLLRMHLFPDSSETHILLLVMHHIVADGATVGLLAAELAQLYAAYEAGCEPDLPPAPDWRGYAAAQSARLEASAFAAVRAFWREHYRVPPEPLQVPADRVRAAQPAYVGASVLLPLPPEVWAATEALARLGRCGAFVVLDAACKSVLQRYTGVEDLVTLFPFAGREQPQEQSLAGMLMRTLPLRLRSGGEDSFARRLELARAELFDVLEQQPFSLEMLSAQMAAASGAGGAGGASGVGGAGQPLSRVMVVYQEAEQTQMRLGGLRVSEYDCGHYPALFDLVFEFTPGARPTLRIHYDTGLFEASRIRRLAGHVFAFLRSAAADPQRPCAQLPLLPEPELREVVSGFNDARAADFGDEGGLSLSELVARRLRAEEQAPAILFCGECWSAAQADALMNRAANLLLERVGLRPEQRVAVVVERSHWLPVLFSGILRAGGCYVPVDPSYPPERVQYMLQDAGCAAVFADVAGRLLVQGCPAPVFSPEDCLAASAELPAVRIDPAQLAYMIYTSGSTGRPKGVLIEHRGAVNLALGLRRAFAITPADRVLQFASCSFDASIFDMVMAFGSGAALVMISRETLTDERGFAAYLRDHDVTMATLTPAFVDALDPQAFLPLRFLMTAGEAARPASARRLQKQLRFINGYGPTETTVCSNWHEVAAEETVGETIPVGAPMYNHRIYILDAGGMPCGIGIPGEICIAGAGVARGYHNRPELTVAVFVPDPFVPGERMYRSGDIGYWTEGGEVVCLGRRDGQIKIRGFRVEIGEIENAMQTVAGVREAVVVVLQDAAGAKTLAAGYIADAAFADSFGTSADAGRVEGMAGAVDAAEAIRLQLAARLPDYMVPPVIVAVEAWPLSPSGKVDRTALAALVRARMTDVRVAGEEAAHEAGGCGADGQGVGDWTPQERIIRGVWATVLGTEPAARDANFFALGGDSIRAIRVVHALREAGLELSAADLLGNPVLCELANKIAANLGTNAPPASARADAEAAGVTGAAGVEGAQSAEYAGVVEATPVQRWYLRQRQLDCRFNQSTLLRCRKPLTQERLRQALDVLTRAHEALRLRALPDEVNTLQVLPAEQARIPLRVVALPGADAAAREQTLQRFAEEEHAGIDPVRGPVFCAMLFEAQEPLLLLTAHHLCVDFVTWYLICEDLSAALTALSAGRPATLSVPALRLRAWGEAIAAYAARSTRRLGFWQKQHGLVAGADKSASDVTALCRDADAVSAPFLLPVDLVRTLREEAAPAFGMDWPQFVCALAGIAYARSSCAVFSPSSPAGAGLWIEANGRNAVAGLPDCGRLAGWFTALYPVWFAGGAGSAGALVDGVVATETTANATSAASAASAAKALLSARTALAAVRDGGLSYGALRYDGAEGERTLSALTQPQALFHYAGGVQEEMENDWFRSCASAPGRAIASERVRPIPVEIVAEDCDGGLAFACSGPAQAQPVLRRFAQETVSLAQAVCVAAGLRQVASGLEYDQFPNDAALAEFLAAL